MVVDEPIIEMLNARSLERAHFEATDWGRALLRELDLVVAVGELESMTTGRTLYDVDLKDRVADFVMPLDRELRLEHLGVVPITGGPRDADMQTIGRRLAALPRGAMAVLGTQREPGGGLPGGYGYDAWMSNGSGTVDTQSGHKFMIARPHGPDTAFRRLYGQVVGGIVYRQRARARDAILQHSMKVATLTPGTRAKGDFYINGRSWSAATFERVVPSHYSGGGDGYPGPNDQAGPWQVVHRRAQPGHGDVLGRARDARPVGRRRQCGPRALAARTPPGRGTRGMGRGGGRCRHGRRRRRLRPLHHRRRRRPRAPRRPEDGRRRLPDRRRPPRHLRRRLPRPLLLGVRARGAAPGGMTASAAECRVDLIGDPADAAAMRGTLVRIRKALGASGVSAENGHVGLGPCAEIRGVIKAAGSANPFIVRLRDDMTSIIVPSGDPRLEINVDQLAGTCGAGGTERERIESALAHVEAAITVLRPDAPTATEVADRLREMASRLAIGVMARHTGMPALKAVLTLDGPFGIGRAHAMISMVAPDPGATTPPVPERLIGILKDLGPVAHAVIEGPTTAMIGAAVNYTTENRDHMAILRALSSDDPGWWE